MLWFSLVCPRLRSSEESFTRYTVISFWTLSICSSCNRICLTLSLTFPFCDRISFINCSMVETSSPSVKISILAFSRAREGILKNSGSIYLSSVFTSSSLSGTRIVTILARMPKKGSQTIVFIILNIEWDMAIYWAIWGASPAWFNVLAGTLAHPNKSKTRYWTKETYCLNIKMIKVTPNTLKTIWAYAALFEAVVPPMLERNAVIVVPMFSPRIRAAAPSKDSTPLIASAMVMPRVALEDWMTMVRIAPTATDMIIAP